MCDNCAKIFTLDEKDFDIIIPLIRKEETCDEKDRNEYLKIYCWNDYFLKSGKLCNKMLHFLMDIVKKESLRQENINLSMCIALDKLRVALYYIERSLLVIFEKEIEIKSDIFKKLMDLKYETINSHKENVETKNIIISMFSEYEKITDICYNMSKQLSNGYTKVEQIDKTFEKLFVLNTKF